MNTFMTRTRSIRSVRTDAQDAECVLPASRLIPSKVARSIAILMVSATLLGAAAQSGLTADPDQYATVDGESISQADIDTILLIRPVKGIDASAARKAAGEQLIDEHLMGEYLKKYKVTVPDESVDRQLRGIARGYLKTDRSLDQRLSDIKSSRNRLRQLLIVPMAWRIHVLRTVTTEAVREYFEKHRAEYDGTQWRVSQILIRAKSDTEREAAIKVLNDIRSEVTSGQITFEEAARKHSQSPSSEQGGDLGFFGYRGQMPISFTSQIVKLKKGEIGQPFASSYGVHLCHVTDMSAGELSLEDVRTAVTAALSRTLWDETVKKLRAEADIKYTE